MRSAVASRRTFARDTSTVAAASATRNAAARTATCGLRGILPRRITATFRPANSAARPAKYGERPGADDPLRELVEVDEHAGLRQETAGQRIEETGGGVDQHWRAAEQRREHERHRRIGGERRRQHADGNKRGAKQPIPEIVHGEQPWIGVAETREHHHVAQRDQDGRGIDAEDGGVLAEDDVRSVAGSVSSNSSVPCLRSSAHVPIVSAATKKTIK